MREVTDKNSKIGAWGYPFIEKYYPGSDWYIISTPVDKSGIFYRKHKDSVERLNPHTWGGYYNPARDKKAFEPTLRWTSDGSVNDLYIRNSSHWVKASDFMATTGLEFDLHKGGFVLSKRISRVMRRFLAYTFMPSADMNIRYLEQDSDQAKVWDGAGVISRSFLNKVSTTGMDKIKAKRVRKELAHASHVEFTIVTERGQDKGHAIVSDSIDCDLIVPTDTKKEVSINNVDTAFFGINFVHGSDDMRLDMQSTVNLYPFFTEDYMLQCVREEGELFVDAIESGKTEQALNKIDGLREGDVSDWHIAEYFASGGKMNWFPSVVRSIMNQHVNRLEMTIHRKLRIPVLGGRYYVMTNSIAQSAGIDIDVPAGHMHIDGDATFYVNDQDWIDFIADVAGGADQDDAFWIHPFTDTDGERKILAWRSPNQLGEYIILKPTADSHEIVWSTVNGDVTWRNADSSVLPKRIDKVSQEYLNLIDPGTSGGLGEGLDYTIRTMTLVIERIKKNRGALGWYCNLSMLQVAVHKELFKVAPAPLEDIIDASVKTGADLTAVKGWCENFVEEWLQTDTAIPQFLSERLTSDPDEDRVILTENHWIDTMYKGVGSHIETMEDETNRLASKCSAPIELINAGNDYLEAGKALRDEYAKAFRMSPKEIRAIEGIKDYMHLFNADKDHNRRIVMDVILERYIKKITPENRIKMVLGAIAHIFLVGKKNAVSDGAIWNKTIAPITLEALRDLGIISHITVTEDGYLGNTPRFEVKPTYRLRLTNVWFNSLKAQGKVDCELPSQITDKSIAKLAKQQVSQWAQAGSFIGKQFTVTRKDNRQMLTSEKGHVLGYITEDQTDMLEDGRIIRMNITQSDNDGNLTVITA